MLCKAFAVNLLRLSRLTLLCTHSSGLAYGQSYRPVVFWWRNVTIEMEEAT